MTQTKQETGIPPTIKPAVVHIVEQPEKIAEIGKYIDAPLFMKDNEHITHGYRINFNNPWRIIKSLFMVHNESVNIWTHLIPAIIISIFIMYFTLFVDRQALAHDLKSYSQSLSDSYDHYTHTLNNLTLIQQMKQMQEMTKTEIQQLRQNAINSYADFTEGINNSIQNINKILQVNVSGIKDSLRNNIKMNLDKLQEIKSQYERVVAPSLIGKIKSYNNTYALSIKDQFLSIKSQIDSDAYEYIDVLHSGSPNPHKVSRWPIIVFLSSALTCLICSALFHLFYPMSSKSYVVFNRFDYAGISLLIAGSTLPPLYYGMYCYLQVALVYQIVIMTLAVGVFIASMFQWMHRKQNASYKALIYGGFGASNLIPVAHLIINDHFFENGDTFTFLSSLPYYLLLGASYLVGLYVYTVRCPERHYPGKFNLCGSSHQIWHIFVVFGIIFTYLGALQNYEMRKMHACPVESFKI